ncbi:MAG TPA: YkgJ family cysteine cluster protein [Syntrophobacteraceae bacterium]|nr:YkgJ family cysteine cluster protein [Syntrophobacteraceae bacterium]
MDIEDLYALIPTMRCIPGCRECCIEFGVPSRTGIEDERIKSFLREHGMEMKHAVGTTCPYVCERGCAIYPVRPFTCRLYGASPNYLCKMGARPLDLLHPDEEADLLYRYQSNFF